MLFKDFNELIEGVRRFLNPSLVEPFKTSEKEEDKLIVEKSALFNKIIMKVMPSIMTKVYMEKGEAILTGDSSSKEEFERSCQYLSDLIGFALALNSAVNVAKAKFKIDSYGSITKKIENHMLIKITRETFYFSERLFDSFNRIGRILLKPTCESNDILMKIKSKAVDNEADIFARDGEVITKVIKVKPEFSKLKSVFEKILYVMRLTAVEGFADNIEGIWAYSDLDVIDYDVVNAGVINISGAKVELKDKDLKAVVTFKFETNGSKCEYYILRNDNDFKQSGQYR